MRVAQAPTPTSRASSIGRRASSPMATPPPAATIAVGDVAARTRVGERTRLVDRAGSGRGDATSPGYGDVRAQDPATALWAAYAGRMVVTPLDDLGRRAKQASRDLALASSTLKDAALVAAAELLIARRDLILAANAEDLDRATGAGVPGDPRPAAA